MFIEQSKTNLVSKNRFLGEHYLPFNVTISDSKFEDNSAVNDGGAIFIFNALVFINKSTFVKNHSFKRGGAIFYEIDNLFQ